SSDLGGAGSGKTTVALYRLARLLENRTFGQSESVVIVPNLGLIRLAENLLEKMGLFGVKVRALDEVFTTLVRQSIRGIPAKVFEEGPLVSGIIKRHLSTFEILKKYAQDVEKNIVNELRKINLDREFQKLSGPLLLKLQDLSAVSHGIAQVKIKE